MILTVLTIIAVVAVLISINALYVAGEFSSVSARKTRIMRLAEEGNRLAQILLPVLEDRHKLDNYIAASQVGITLSSIVLGIYGEQQIAPHIAPWIARLPLGGQAAAAGLASTLVLISLTTLQVVMGELVPKSIGVQYPERLALLTALPMKWSADYLLKPLIILLNGSGAFILKLLGITPSEGHAHVHSPEEILILVKESRRGGLIDPDESLYLQNVLRRSRVRAGEIAIPRTQMVAVPADRPVEEVLRLAAESPYSRIPVYRGDIDHIVGFVHLRDLFTLYRTDPQADIGKIVRSLPFVPETLPIAQVWERLDEDGSYLAIVLDEFGGTAGLITREDLIEELFGEVQDEFDQEEEPLTPVDGEHVSVRGDVLIGELNDLLGTSLPQGKVHTVGGLLMDRLGRIPEKGEAVVIGNVRLEAEAVERRRVTQVRVTLLSRSEGGEEA